jgi:hypothetical protein
MREFANVGQSDVPLDVPRSEAENRCMIQTHAGQLIEVRDAFGRTLQRIATGPVDPGYEFAVVWACRPEEWAAAQAEGREPKSVPWPIEDVRVVEHVIA